MLSNELTKSGRQETCLKEIQSIYKEIYQGFKDQPKKIYLTDKIFISESHKIMRKMSRNYALKLNNVTNLSSIL